MSTSMNVEIVETQMREILGPAWKAPRTEHDRNNYAALRDIGDVPWIAHVGGLWQVAATHPSRPGEMCIVSVDADGIALAHRLAAMVQPFFADKLGPAPEALEQDDWFGDEALAEEAERGESPGDGPEQADDRTGEPDLSEREVGFLGDGQDPTVRGGDKEADGAFAAAAYPGISILPDDLGTARNTVLAEITRQKLIRLEAATDKSRFDWLADQAQEYHHLGFLGRPISTELERAYNDYLAAKDSRERVHDWAAGYERSAIDAQDVATLQAMLKELHGGG